MGDKRWKGVGGFTAMISMVVIDLPRLLRHDWCCAASSFLPHLSSHDDEWSSVTLAVVLLPCPSSCTLHHPHAHTPPFSHPHAHTQRHRHDGGGRTRCCGMRTMLRLSDDAINAFIMFQMFSFSSFLCGYSVCVPRFAQYNTYLHPHLSLINTSLRCVMSNTCVLVEVCTTAHHSRWRTHGAWCKLAWMRQSELGK